MIKRYIDVAVPVSACNLRCSYCYITQRHLFASKIPPLDYSIPHIRKALSIKRLGGKSLFNLCGGGETMLPNYIVPLTNALLEEGHYVMIVTNGTLTQRIKEFISHISHENRTRLFFKISFHYLELKRRNLLDIFFNNIDLIRESGISFTLEATPSDELIPHIEDMKRICIERVGALCHITIARDDRKKDKPILTSLSYEEYRQVWEQFNSPLFDYKFKIFGERRKEFCYNGLFGGILDLSNGIFRRCYNSPPIQNIFLKPDMPIKFSPIGKCMFSHCYNGHSWLVLGVIPELDSPSYIEMRDRTDINGSHWVLPEMREVFSHRLIDSNSQWSHNKKNVTLILRSMQRIFRKICRKIGRIK